MNPKTLKQVHTKAITPLSKSVKKKRKLNAKKALHDPSSSEDECEAGAAHPDTSPSALPQPPPPPSPTSHSAPAPRREGTKNLARAPSAPAKIASAHVLPPAFSGAAELAGVHGEEPLKEETQGLSQGAKGSGGGAVDSGGGELRQRKDPGRGGLMDAGSRRPTPPPPPPEKWPLSTYVFLFFSFLLLFLLLLLRREDVVRTPLAGGPVLDSEDGPSFLDSEEGPYFLS